MVIEGTLMGALLSALGASTASVATKNAMDLANNKNKAKLGNPDTYVPFKSTIGAIKNVFDSLKNEKQKREALLLLAEAGFSTPELNAIEKTGEISSADFARIPPSLQKKLAKLIGQDVDTLLASIGGPEIDPDDDEETKKKKQQKSDDTKEKVKREIDKAKNYQKGEETFDQVDSKSKAIREAEKLAKNKGKEFNLVEQEKINPIKELNRLQNNINGEVELNAANTPEARGIRNMKNFDRTVKNAKNTNDSAARHIWESASEEWRASHPGAKPPKLK